MREENIRIENYFNLNDYKKENGIYYHESLSLETIIFHYLKLEHLFNILYKTSFETLLFFVNIGRSILF